MFSIIQTYTPQQRALVGLVLAVATNALIIAWPAPISFLLLIIFGIGGLFLFCGALL